MAIIVPSFQKVHSQDSGIDAVVITWANLTNAGPDSGQPVQRPALVDRSVQVTGTFGAGGAVVFEGSNDGVNFYTLNSPQGSALSVTVAGLTQVTEASAWMRPRITGGDGTTSLTVTVCARRTLR
jgi:hypothetical protein